MQAPAGGRARFPGRRRPPLGPAPHARPLAAHTCPLTLPPIPAPAHRALLPCCSPAAERAGRRPSPRRRRRSAIRPVSCPLTAQIRPLTRPVSRYPTMRRFGTALLLLGLLALAALST